MIKDNAWLLYFLLPVHSNVMQSFLLKHEAPQSLLLKTCLREVNIEANAAWPLLLPALLPFHSLHPAHGLRSVPVILG